MGHIGRKAGPPSDTTGLLPVPGLSLRTREEVEGLIWNSRELPTEGAIEAMWGFRLSVSWTEGRFLPQGC